MNERYKAAYRTAFIAAVPIDWGCFLIETITFAGAQRLKTSKPESNNVMHFFRIKRSSSACVAARASFEYKEILKKKRSKIGQDDKINFTTAPSCLAFERISLPPCFWQRQLANGQSHAEMIFIVIAHIGIAVRAA